MFLLQMALGSRTLNDSDISGADCCNIVQDVLEERVL